MTLKFAMDVDTDLDLLAANANPHVFGAAASGHGKYKTITDPQERDGNRLQVEYFTQDLHNHAVQFKTSAGGDMAMIDYEVLGPAAKNALDNFDFGSANVPFNQKNFINNLAEAWIA
jgi:hypothetical protein